MSYQVLARKYRPANFEELEGQEHVLRALINALDNDRLHHAYLFTGTRGVGKTTIARILAKCLSCENGVSSKPCGECSACREIAEGRSVDLIEVDAASRTRVEDTRELLDNVQYMPTRSRFKVYLIDEVHMLSNHSFNALLKTLEEPPEHVKFLLATTDPKKLPITVLSRCLQFNLKNLSPERIVNHLKQILATESIEYEENALWQLGRAADGSMRDALSLTDQAISYGNNSVRDADVKQMLGSIDQKEVFGILNALFAKNAAELLATIQHLSEFSPDYGALMGDILSILHRVAVAQEVPTSVDNSHGDEAVIRALAESVHCEDLQLFYQIGLMGQRDLAFAPDARTGFEMSMLRMLTFTPEELPQISSETTASSEDAKKKTLNNSESAQGTLASLLAKPALRSESADAVPASIEQPTEQHIEHKSEKRVAAEGQPSSADSPELNTELNNSPVPTQSYEQSSQAEGKITQAEVTTSIADAQEQKQDGLDANAGLDLSQVPKSEKHQSAPDISSLVSEPQDQSPSLGASSLPMLEPENWDQILPLLGLTGVTLSLASNCMVKTFTKDACELVLNEHHATMWNNTHETRIQTALAIVFAQKIQVTVTIGETTVETPAEKDLRLHEEAHARAVEVIEADENIKKLIENFDGHLDPSSIQARG
ncbi:MAG: DNA polymerase III subunit gamma/tau [Pseudomonadales bacterium]|jgi:DNA polymerase-3 subunit gamma/tau|tara:strand:+ start:6869 stop:8845 length:1977 start_codon:yes stop_codon:yes gene_type:complete